MTEIRAATAPTIIGRSGSRGKGPTVGGLAVPFSSAPDGGFSQPLPWTETFLPSAFDLQAGSRTGFREVTGNYWHETPLLLGTVRSGTMTVEVRSDGLYYTLQLPAALEYVSELVQRGDLPHASVEFANAQSQWAQHGERSVRIITSAELVGVALVGSPAYTQSTCGPVARSLASEEAVRSLEAHDRAHAGLRRRGAMLDLEGRVRRLGCAVSLLEKEKEVEAALWPKPLTIQQARDTLAYRRFEEQTLRSDETLRRARRSGR